MSDIKLLVELLKSGNANKRFDACEELRVSPQPLPPEAMGALKNAMNDPDPDVADAAQRAFALHAPPPEASVDKKKPDLEQPMVEKTVYNPRPLAVASLCLGILSLATLFGIWAWINGWLPGSSIGSFPLLLGPGFGLLAVILGILAIIRSREPKSMAVLGILLGIPSLLMTCFIILTGGHGIFS